MMLLYFFWHILLISLCALKFIAYIICLDLSNNHLNIIIISLYSSKLKCFFLFLRTILQRQINNIVSLYHYICICNSYVCIVFTRHLNVHISHRYEFCLLCHTKFLNIMFFLHLLYYLLIFYFLLYLL